MGLAESNSDLIMLHLWLLLHLRVA